MDHMDDSVANGRQNHVQVTFFCNDEKIANIPDAQFDVPTTANCDNLNSLVNASILGQDDDWSEKRFEFLIGDTFLRSTLEEFIEEFLIETEKVLKIECVLGLQKPDPLHDLPAPDWVSSIHVIENHLVGTTYNGEVIVWDKKGKKQLEVTRDEGSAYKCSTIIKSPKSAKSPNGLVFVVGGESQALTVLEVSDGQLIAKAILRGHERSVESVALNKDGSRLISGAFDSNIKVWNMTDDGANVVEKVTANNDKSKKKKENYVTKTPMVTLGGHKDAVVGISWATWNPAHCVSASWDHTIAVWDLELAGEVSRLRHTKAFTALDINTSNGIVLASSTDAIPRLYDPRSLEGSVVKQSFIGHNGWVSGVKWNPENSNVFVSCSFDKVVKMWDVRSNKTSLFDLHGHEDRVLCVGHGLGGIIASGGADNSVKVFGH